MKPAVLALLAAATVGCGTGVPTPAALDPRHDSCGTCRMMVSSPAFASQVIAPGEEPVFFDDLGCLAKYLESHRPMPAGWTAFVADHRTGEWADASAATYTSAPAVETPMGSHLVAHASPSSRDADASVRGGRPVPLSSVFPALSERGGR